MYGRYSNIGKNNMTVDQVNRNRLKTAAILVLAIALIVMAAVSIPALRSKNDSRELFIHQMQNECDEAVALANKLSRTGGTPTAGQLSQIRCNLYAIRSINVLSGQDGVRMLDENEISELISQVDVFYSVLTTGGETAEKVSSLQNGLLALQEKINALE